MCSGTSKPQRNRKDACRLLLMIPNRANPIRWTCCRISQAKATGAALQSERCIKRGFSKPIVLVWNGAVRPWRRWQRCRYGPAEQAVQKKPQTSQRWHRETPEESLNETLKTLLECQSCNPAFKITPLHSKTYFLHTNVSKLWLSTMLFQNFLSLMVPS